MEARNSGAFEAGQVLGFGGEVIAVVGDGPVAGRALMFREGAG